MFRERSSPENAAPAREKVGLWVLHWEMDAFLKAESRKQSKKVEKLRNVMLCLWCVSLLLLG